MPVIKIFTDGSCNPACKIGAWAAILLFGSKKAQLHGNEQNTNHQRMELLAVIKAVEFADANFGNAPIEIYTDSQYVARITDRKDKLIKNEFITKRGNLLHNSDLIELIIHQIEAHSITFIKVKAHQRINNEGDNRLEFNPISFNIEVDKLARLIVREEVSKVERN